MAGQYSLQCSVKQHGRTVQPAVSRLKYIFCLTNQREELSTGKYKAMP